MQDACQVFAAACLKEVAQMDLEPDEMGTRLVQGLTGFVAAPAREA